ncbi:hypothetical protein LCGC14_0789690 [marine sediment metagenome]|uniref:Prohead serine protease domain-containing protein n=1 Tax=marine sediment metagenome TaxID=412755 RepID=A0A0F9T024_9ZZZZ
MKTKAIQIKAIDGAGAGIARIATLNVIDSDGDLTKPGAFGEQTVKVLPTHNWGSIPLGKARVFEKGDEALAEFQLNLDIEPGREWHSALKFDLDNGQPIQKWSYGYDVLKSSEDTIDDQSVRILESLKVHEVSPVVSGAGIDTRTLSIKGIKVALVPTHDTPVSDAVWDDSAERRRGAKIGFAWGDAFLHHFEDGAASIRACVKGIAQLDGFFARMTLSSDEREGAHFHMATHLKDADYAVPELNKDTGTKLIDQITQVIWEVEAVTARLAEVKAERIEKGRSLGIASTVGTMELDAVLTSMAKASLTLGAVLDSGVDDAEARRLLADFTRTRIGRSF